MKLMPFIIADSTARSPLPMRRRAVPSPESQASAAYVAARQSDGTWTTRRTAYRHKPAAPLLTTSSERVALLLLDRYVQCDVEIERAIEGGTDTLLDWLILLVKEIRNEIAPTERVYIALD